MLKITKISAFVLSQVLEENPAVKVLGYVMKYADGSGIYQARKGTRIMCCRRLGISLKQYERAIGELCRMGVLKRYKNASGSKYGFYGLEGMVKEVWEMNKIEGNLMIVSQNTGFRQAKGAELQEIEGNGKAV